jgi:hypothetical protein
VFSVAPAKSAAARANDASYILKLLSDRYGSSTSRISLGTLRQRNSQLDRFDWALLIVAIEIDLRVRIPRRMVNSDRMTIGQFASRIASLPKVHASNHTLELINLLARALLSAQD